MTSRIPAPLLAHRCRPVDRLHRRRRVRARRRARRRADRRRRLHRGRGRRRPRSATGSASRGGATASPPRRRKRWLTHCFGAGGFGRLTCGHFIDNPASARVIAKLGFRRIGKGAQWCEARKSEVGDGKYTRAASAAGGLAECCAMKFLDQAKIYIASGAGGDGSPQLPAREVHRVRRTRRRRRRQGRRRVGRVRRQSQHADRLPLPAALQGQEGRQRRRQEPRRRQRRRLHHQGAARHADLSPRTRRRCSPICRRSASARCSPRAATAASATRISNPRPTRRRAASTPASRPRS